MHPLDDTSPITPPPPNEFEKLLPSLPLLNRPASIAATCFELKGTSLHYNSADYSNPTSILWLSDGQNLAERPFRYSALSRVSPFPWEDCFASRLPPILFFREEEERPEVTDLPLMPSLSFSVVSFGLNSFPPAS